MDTKERKATIEHHKKRLVREVQDGIDPNHNDVNLQEALSAIQERVDMLRQAIGIHVD